MNRAAVSSLWLAAALILAAATATGGDDGASGPTWVVIVRHAEKASDSDDPPLTPAGRERAERLRRTLSDLDVAALIASQYRRARQTLEPLAKQLESEIRIVPVDPAAGVASRAAALADEIKNRHRGETVVVAGHSNTVPLLIEALGVEAAPVLDESDYDDLFVIRIDRTGAAELLHLHYGSPTR